MGRTASKCSNTIMQNDNSASREENISRSQMKSYIVKESSIQNQDQIEPTNIINIPQDNKLKFTISQTFETEYILAEKLIQHFEYIIKLHQMYHGIVKNSCKFNIIELGKMYKYRKKDLQQLTPFNNEESFTKKQMFGYIIIIFIIINYIIIIIDSNHQHKGILRSYNNRNSFGTTRDQRLLKPLADTESTRKSKLYFLLLIVFFRSLDEKVKYDKIKNKEIDQIKSEIKYVCVKLEIITR